LSDIAPFLQNRGNFCFRRVPCIARTAIFTGAVSLKKILSGFCSGFLISQSFICLFPASPSIINSEIRRNAHTHSDSKNILHDIRQPGSLADFSFLLLIKKNRNLSGSFRVQHLNRREYFTISFLCTELRPGILKISPQGIFFIP